MKCFDSKTIYIFFGFFTAFPGLYNAVVKLHKEIKEAGRAETDNTPPIPDETMDAIFAMAAIHQKLFEARLEMDEECYQEALRKIPEEYQDKYHISFALLMQFLMTLMDGRRGAEGIELLTKKHWAIVNENGKTYLKKVSWKYSKV